jgi:hypothetical protein
MTLEFVRSHRAFDYIKDDEIIEHYKLFHLEKPRLLVQIVAERVAQSDQRPHYAYRSLTDE